MKRGGCRHQEARDAHTLRHYVSFLTMLDTFGSVGTPTSVSVRKYLNDLKVPQLFVGSGADFWGDYQHYPRRAEPNDGSLRMIPANAKAIRSALEAAGIQFIPENGGGPGVRLRKAVPLKRSRKGTPLKQA